LSALTWIYGRRLAVVAASVVTASALTGGPAGEERIVDPLGRAPSVSPIEVRLVSETFDTSIDANRPPTMPADGADHVQGAA
jgi:hypothetical protein